MTYSDFVAGQLALFAWRESKKYGSNYNHGKAIINCMANRQRAGLCGGDMLSLSTPPLRWHITTLRIRTGEVFPISMTSCLRPSAKRRRTL